MLSRAHKNAKYDELYRDAHAIGGHLQVQSLLRELCLTDLFFLLTRGCGRLDVNNDFLYERCNEVQANPDGHLDLWSREHYKSTIITYGMSIQDILNNPEITIGIFSHTKPIARAFLRQIKYELETNERLKTLFPDILYSNPRKESPIWSEDKGLVVIRKNNPKESTVEAHGLVDGQPTSKHFSLLVYDDVVTRESVTSPDMIRKTTDAWALSLNLGAHGGSRRYIGTRYHFNDTWGEMMNREAAVPRIHSATKNGKPDGEPVFLTRESLAEKRREMGPYVYACQMLQNPTADAAQGFKKEWLKFWFMETQENLNKYIIVDPAGEKRKENDYTSMFVVGLGRDKNYYILDMIRDRLNLTERTQRLFLWHQRYKPIGIGYEKYGMQSDIEHIEYVQAEKNYRFEVTPMGGQTPKNDRIRRLIPLFEQGRVYFPKNLNYVDYEGRMTDLTQAFINEEYIPFPVMAHDDMLDCLARIQDPDFDMVFPITEQAPVVITQAEKDWMEVMNTGNEAAFNMEM